MKTYRAFEVSYKGPTDYRGSRIRIRDCAYDKTIFVSYNYEYLDACGGGLAYLQEHGFVIAGGATTKNSKLYFTEDFETDLK